MCRHDTPSRRRMLACYDNTRLRCRYADVCLYVGYATIVTSATRRYAMLRCFAMPHATLPAIFDIAPPLPTPVRFAAAICCCRHATRH